MPISADRNFQTVLDRVRSALDSSKDALIKCMEISVNGNLYPMYKVVLGQGNSRRVLISAGIHGDEPAGVEAVCRFLEQKRYLPFQQNWELTLLPCINPTGYETGTRENHANKDLNREFKLEHPQTEVEFAKSVFTKTFDLTLELHEDVDSQGFYLYQKERPGAEPGLVRRIMQRVKNILPINVNSKIDGLEAEAGVISRFPAPSEMDWWPMAVFSYTQGTQSCFTLETPTQPPLHKRVEAHLEAIDAALE